jgi:hypothetical protein
MAGLDTASIVENVSRRVQIRSLKGAVSYSVIREIAAYEAAKTQQ